MLVEGVLRIDGDLQVGRNGCRLLVITSDRIGIGTMNSCAKLDIKGDVNFNNRIRIMNAGNMFFPPAGTIPPALIDSEAEEADAGCSAKGIQ